MWIFFKVWLSKESNKLGRYASVLKIGTTTIIAGLMSRVLDSACFLLPFITDKRTIIIVLAHIEDWTDAMSVGLELTSKAKRGVQNKFDKAKRQIATIDEIADNFFNAGLEVISEPFDVRGLTRDDVVAVCPVKDSRNLLPLFLSHHRSIGIKRFVFIDNDSSDGTLEFLAVQPDCCVFSTKRAFASGVPALGWVSRVLEHYGPDRWYLVLDIDELFVYNGIEEGGINGIIRYARKHRIRRVRSFMLDVYPKSPLLEVEEDQARTIEGIKNTYKYVDRDSYRACVGGMAYRPTIEGGPRLRVFGPYGSDAPLQKFPLFLYGKGDIRVSNHYLWPLKKNARSPLISALLHYKFLPGDREKYEDYIRTGTHYGGSQEYRAYVTRLQEDPQTTLFYDGSTEYTDSSSLGKLPIMDKIELA
jgi:predicted nucleic acid-binding protein